MSLVSISCFVCSLFSPRLSSLLSRFLSLFACLVLYLHPCRGPCGARGRKTGRLLARARKINQDRARIENAIYDRDCYPRPLCLSIREAHEPLSTDPPRDCQTPRGTEHLRIPRARMLAEQGDARRLCLTGQLQTKNQSAEFRAFANTQSKRLAPRRMRGVNRRPPDGLSDPQGHRTPTERLLARERRRALPAVVVGPKSDTTNTQQ